MSKVQLYVYDLSNGMARQMSLQLTGRQIDGIWHTSVVVFGKEVFYGQGISITRPGYSHHGRPLYTLDMGETALDEETFQEYLSEIRSHYTADKYHLLDFNCNSFTNDVIGFLTGGSIPAWIKDLPADFLSTPFGAALRPTIDNMFRRGAAPGVSAPPTARPTASSLVQSVAAQAASGTPPAPSLAATQSLTGPLHVSTNAASLRSLLSSHKAAAVLFTAPATCPPCRIVDPAFESLAHEKVADGMAFVKVDLDVGRGRECAAEWSVRATPTVMFFLNGNKVNEVRGANLPEIKTQIDLLLYELYPPHPHTQLKLPAIQSISLKPILFSDVRSIDAALSKLLSFIDELPSDALNKADARTLLQNRVPPLLKNITSSGTSTSDLTAVLQSWSATTVTLVRLLTPDKLFPLVDFWRIALLAPGISAALSANASLSQGIDAILNLAFSTGSSSPRTFLLTTLRMTSNLLARDDLGGKLLLADDRRQRLVSWVVSSLLSDESPVRVAAASLVFNLGAAYQRSVRDALEKRKTLESDQEWEVEMVSALVEALERETASEDVVHRLAASLALFVYLSPAYRDQLADLLNVLQAKKILLSKLGPGGCGEKGVQKKEVRVLVRELADNLCPS